MNVDNENPRGDSWGITSDKHYDGE